MGRPPAVKPQGIDIAGAPARLAATVKMSFRYICTGSSDLAPRRNAAVGAVGPRITSHCREGPAEVVGDQAAHLLRLEVVGVVVAVRQHVGADQDAPLDLGAEALGARLPVHVEQVGVLARRGGRSARRRSATGSTTPRPARSRSRPAPRAGRWAASTSTVVAPSAPQLGERRRRSPRPTSASTPAPKYSRGRPIAQAGQRRSRRGQRRV